MKRPGAGRGVLVASLLATAACSHASARPAAGPHAVVNPVVLQRADPSVYRHTDGFYYLTDSVPDFDGVELRRATTLEGLATAVPVMLFHRPATGPQSGWIWAPDLEYDAGIWYLHYSASPSADRLDQRLYTMETTAADPLTGAWKQDGELRTGWESYATDPTSFTSTDGRSYLVWGQKTPGTQGESAIYIGLLGTPTSLLGTQVQLSAPQYPWEEDGVIANAAPAVLQSHGRVFVTYSAGAPDASYAMGLLSAPVAANPLDPTSWTKSPTPVFVTSAASSVYGPGSNSFTLSDGGGDVVDLYAARSSPEVSDPLTDPHRNLGMQRVSWLPDGTPDLGTPVPDGPTPE